MRAYADSSFILGLVVREAGSEKVISEYRRLNRPSMFYLPLHAVEIENAVRQRVFREQKARPARDRTRIRRERDAALSRLGRLRESVALNEATLDMDIVMNNARVLSSKHTERLGARAIDTLHVACALELKAEIFLTSDIRQSGLAKAAGLKTVSLRKE